MDMDSTVPLKFQRSANIPEFSKYWSKGRILANVESFETHGKQISRILMKYFYPRKRIGFRLIAETDTLRSNHFPKELYKTFKISPEDKLQRHCTLNLSYTYANPLDEFAAADILINGED